MGYDIFQFFFNGFTLLAIAIGLFYYYSIATYNHWKKLKIKHLKPVPLFGNSTQFIFFKKSLQQLQSEAYNTFKNEPFYGIYQLRDPVLVLRDPQIINDFLIKDFKNFYDRGAGFYFPDKKVNPLSMHLFRMEGERWRSVRQRLSPAFTSGKLKQMYDQMLNCAEMFSGFIEKENIDTNGVSLDVKEMCERFTMDVIGSFAFGLECNSLKSNDEFVKYGTEVFKPRLSNSIRLLAGIINSKLPPLLGIPDLPNNLKNFFLNLSLEMVQYRRKNAVKRNDVMEQLMALQNTYINPKYKVPDTQTKLLVNEEFDEIDIAANSYLFFEAGFETTATTLSFCLYEITVNQHVQDKLRKEIEEVRKKYNGEINADILKEMKYMDAVISETLRIYPAVMLLIRKCTEPYVIRDTNIKLNQGTSVMVPVYAIHHDPNNFADPEKFDPERFYNEENVKNRPPGSYLPFGDGPRYCIGRRFALLEIKTALAYLLPKYKFEPCEKTEIPLTFKNSSVMLSPKNGLWTHITKLKK